MNISGDELNFLLQCRFFDVEQKNTYNRIFSLVLMSLLQSTGKVIYILQKIISAFA